MIIKTKDMKTLKQILEIIEKAGFSIEKYTQEFSGEEKFCGYELSGFTDGGVNEILFLDFRDEGKDPENVEDFIKEFESYVNDFSIDDRIETNRYSKDYCNAFSITESVVDFTNFQKELQDILEKIN